MYWKTTSFSSIILIPVKAITYPQINEKLYWGPISLLTKDTSTYSR